MDLLVQQVANGFVIGATYALIALGLTLIFGVLDVVNFAHGEFYMVGAIGTAWIGSELDWPYWLAAVAAIAGAMLVASLLERTTLRPVLREADPIRTLVLTFGWALILSSGSTLVFGAAGRRVQSPLADELLNLGPAVLTFQHLLIVLALPVLIGGLYLFLNRTNLGKAVRATAQSRDAALAIGIDVDRVSMSTMLIGSGLAALAGALIGPLISATPGIGLNTSIKAFVIVILGGMGSVPGAIAGGLLLGVLETVGSISLGAQWQDVTSYSVLIVAMLLFPSGMFGSRGRSGT